MRYGRSDGQRDQQQGGGYGGSAGGGRGGYGGGAAGGSGYGGGIDMSSMGGMAAMPMAGMGGMGMMMGNSLVSLVPVQLPNGQVGLLVFKMPVFPTAALSELWTSVHASQVSPWKARGVVHACTQLPWQPARDPQC